MGALERSVPQVGFLEVGFPQVGAPQVRVVQPCVLKIGLFELRILEVGLVQPCVTQVGSLEHGALEAGVLEVRFAEVGPLSTVLTAEPSLMLCQYVLELVPVHDDLSLVVAEASNTSDPAAVYAVMNRTSDATGLSWLPAVDREPYAWTPALSATQ
jgi:hypothetical protein